MEQDNIVVGHKKTELEHQYTSTGIKFWRHKASLLSYKEGGGNTVISTHVSPEGSCNLNCPYCSVSKRDRHNRIKISVIKDYILKLKTRGLQAVILTGGGEPTLYPQINELIRWIYEEQNLSVAMITNGTNTDRIEHDIWDMFSWVRISINFFDGYKTRIKFPDIKGVLGASVVYDGQGLDELKELSEFIDKDKVTYVRVLPNCLLQQDKLIEEHKKINEVISELGDKRFFQQFKVHGVPCSEICHQAYFRPYLSEVDGGTVFPCDSLVLNNEQMHFAHKYAICKAKDVLDFLDHKVNLNFSAKELCEGCVFTDNLKLLDDWYKYGSNKFDQYNEEIRHEEFV